MQVRWAGSVGDTLALVWHGMRNGSLSNDREVGVEDLDCCKTGSLMRVMPVKI